LKDVGSDPIDRAEVDKTARDFDSHATRVDGIGQFTRLLFGPPGKTGRDIPH
jgi:hypothetical protein